jgi:DNA polymerase elongation subunit (family B)
VKPPASRRVLGCVNAYEDGADVVVLRRDAGKLLVTRHKSEHVVYLRRSDVPTDMLRQLRSSPHVAAIREEDAWLRVGWKDPGVRRAVVDARGYLAEKGLKTYEGDVDPVRRFFTDTGTIVSKPRRCYLDIETDSRVSIRDAVAGSARVLSWVVTDDAGEMCSGLLADEGRQAEADLLGRLWEVLGAYDQVLAWNGDWFDFPVIVARSDEARVRVDPRRWLWLDHLLLFKRMNMHSAESGDEKQSMKLERICQSVLGEGKDDFDSSKTWEAWEAGGADRERLLRYNAKDTDLLRKLEARKGYAALFDAVARTCSVLPNTRGLNPTIQMDGFLLRLGLERGIHFPTKHFREARGDQYRGAFVMQPKTQGIARNVHVADYSAMYPSIILTWNMSPETKRSIPINGPVPAGHCRAPLTGHGFDNATDGILPVAIRALMELRKESNERKAGLHPGSREWHEADNESTAYKVVVNSFYGVLGAPTSRFYDPDIAESVTQNGVWLIRKTIEAAENRGMQVVYGDTDSLFVVGCTQTAFEEFVRWCNAELYPPLLGTVGCVRNEVKLAYEKAFDRAVFVGAKRYAAVYLHYKGKAPKPLPQHGESFDPSRHSHPEVKGLEYKRGDAALLARGLQERVINMLMLGEEHHGAYHALLDETLGHVLNDVLPSDEVVLSKSLTKSLREYEQGRKPKKDGTKSAEPVHVQVARMLATRGQPLAEGSRVEYFVADGSDNLVVRPIVDYGESQADRYYLWETLVYPPTQRLLAAAFPDHNWTTGYEKIRPKRPRQRRGLAVPEEQLGLAGMRARDEGQSIRAVEVHAAEDFGEEYLLDLKGLSTRFPGARPLVIHLALRSGAIAVIEARGVGVSDSFLPAAEDLHFWYAETCAALSQACAG